MTSINIGFSTEIDDDVLSIVIDLVKREQSINRFSCDFDFYRFPISININRRIRSINIDDID